MAEYLLMPEREERESKSEGGERGSFVVVKKS